MPRVILATPHPSILKRAFMLGTVCAAGVGIAVFILLHFFGNS